MRSRITTVIDWEVALLSNRKRSRQNLSMLPIRRYRNLRHHLLKQSESHPGLKQQSHPEINQYNCHHQLPPYIVSTCWTYLDAGSSLACRPQVVRGKAGCTAFNVVVCPVHKMFEPVTCFRVTAQLFSTTVTNWFARRLYKRVTLPEGNHTAKESTSTLFPRPKWHWEELQVP